MRVQSLFSKIVLLGLVFLTAPLSAQADPAAVPDTRQVAEVVQGEALAGQCKAQPAQKEELPVFLPQPVRKQEFTCYNCEACAGQMVNKACCFSPIGHPWCVSSCTSGCNPNGGGGGPTYPTEPIDP